MRAQQLAETYLDALSRADLGAMLSLFSDGALAHSPLYGPTQATDFYRDLFDNTAEAQPTLRGVTQGATADGTPLVSIWFRFSWRLLSGKHAVFDVVDLLELAADERIDALHIIYDTADVRSAVKQEPHQS